MPASSAAKRMRPKSYSVAVYLVALVLILQLGLILGVIPWLRNEAVKIETRAPESVLTQAPRSLPLDPKTALLDPPNLKVTPQSGRLNVVQMQDTVSRVTVLLGEAKKFQKEGAYSLAQAALEEAEKLQPDALEIWAAQARLADAQKNQTQKAFYWRKVVERGGNSSPYYDEARQALWPRSLFFAEVNKTMEQDLQMKIAIAAAPLEERIEVGKVRIQLLFYEQLPSGEVTYSTARQSHRFENTRPNWTNADRREVLSAIYQLQPQLENKDRRYYGYVFRIYYKGRLQDERAEPAHLLTMFPAALQAG